MFVWKNDLIKKTSSPDRANWAEAQTAGPSRRRLSSPCTTGTPPGVRRRSAAVRPSAKAGLASRALYKEPYPPASLLLSPAAYRRRPCVAPPPPHRPAPPRRSSPPPAPRRRFFYKTVRFFSETLDPFFSDSPVFLDSSS